jgi:hypothetical protein
MSDIFISYAREDRDKAKALAELCQQQDWSVWWDRRIPPGRSFDEVIEEALGAAKCVVVLWSKSSASSDWVKGEAAEGLRRKILVPVRIDSANVPLEFRRLQTVDLSDWKGEAGHLELGGFLEAVAANIKAVVQRPPSEGSQRKLMKPVLTVLAIVALLAAGFAFYKFAGARARLGSRGSAGGSPAPQPPQTLTPTPVAAKSSPIATASIDIDKPTPLTSNEIMGNGVGEVVSYYYTFNAGPGEVKVTVDGKNKPSRGQAPSAHVAGFTDAIAVEISDLDAKNLLHVNLGYTQIGKREVERFQLRRRQQVILRILLSEDTLDYKVRVDDSIDFSPAPKLQGPQ